MIISEKLFVSVTGDNVLGELSMLKFKSLSRREVWQELVAMYI